MKKKIIAIVVAVLMIFSLTACGDNQNGSKGIANVWTASGTERLLGNVDYSSRYGSTSLSIEAFKNEYENAQIIISAHKNIGKYKIEVADLTDGKGNILPASAFELYHEKYMYVGQIKNHNSPTGIGYYPDALLPLEIAQEYRETSIKKDFNQAVWVNLCVPETQEAGVYSGQFKVILDGKETSISVSVKVFDYLLDGAVHSKSAFHIHPQRLAWGEKDDSREMQEKYYEYLLSYRVSPTHFPGIDLTYVTLDGDEMDRWLAYAEKYTLDERCSHFNIPYTQTVEQVDGKNITCVDWENFTETLTIMAEYSAEHGVNLFEKAGTYFTFFDEYDINGTTDIANHNLNKAYKLCETLAEELEPTLSCEQQLKTEILNDLAGLKHKVVGSYTDELIADKAQFVPTIDRFNTEEGRTLYKELDEKSYGNDGEMWTYTCMSPRPPYPTYHFDDTLLSSRLLSWMMYDYDIVGNLYWDTVFYTYYEQTNIYTELQLQDYYDTALRYPSANGDGFLLYPGRPYGIDGPVGSIRLQSVRDGNEDYDLFYALENFYTERGVDSAQLDNLLELLQRNLYSGTAVRINTEMYEQFANSRQMLAGLLVSAAKAGTIIESIRAEHGNMKIVVSAPNSTALKLDGTTLSGVQDGNLIRYQFEIALDKAVNMLTLTSSTQEGDYTLSLNLGGMSKTVSASELNNKVNMITGGSASLTEIEGVDSLRMDYTYKDRMVADVDMSSLNITATAVNVRIQIYLYGEQEISVTLRAKCEESSVYDEVTTVKLLPGWNEISVPTLSLGCQAYGTLNYLRFNPKGESAVSLALGDITIEG